MKLLFTFLTCIFLATAGYSQVTHEVEAGGGGLGNPLPYYTPSVITIHVGDTVRWTNIQGTHNVHGGTDDFPNNPVSFSSGNPASAPWVYEMVFTVPGEYGYHCTQGNHSDFQFGTITVLMASGLEELSSLEMNIFPNPVANRLAVESSENIIEVSITDVSGRIVLTETYNDVAQKRYLGTFDLSSGLYSVAIKTNKGSAVRRLYKD